MIDSDLPPLPQLVTVANSAFTMRCMTDDALRELQREAFKAGMEKATQVCAAISGDFDKDDYSAQAIGAQHCFTAIRALAATPSPAKEST